MKIVFLTSSLNSGGAERVATMLCNAWAARGDSVTLIPTYSRGGSPFYALSERVETVFLAQVTGVARKKLWGYAPRLIALRKLIIERDPDVVISFLPNVNIAAILSTFFLRKPLIICERSDPSNRSSRNIWEIGCKLMYRFADMLAVQTESVAAKASALYPGVEKIRIVPNPLSERMLPSKAAATGARKVLLSLGRLSAEKQIDKIIDAFAELASRHDDWDLHIYGEGPMKEALAAKISDRRLQRRAFLKGVTKEPWKIMAGSDAFVMNSKYEGFPNALLEAMGTGLACIATDCPSGPREITRNGKHALLVPPGDPKGLVEALARVMSDESLRISLGMQARESVLDRFSTASVMDIWDKLFDEVKAA